MMQTGDDLWVAEQYAAIAAMWKYNRMVDVHLALDRPRPANKSLADWRMALRRKINGDTR